MKRMQIPEREHSSQSGRSVEKSTAAATRGLQVHRPADLHVRYEVPRERGLTWFLVSSVCLFTVATCLAALIPAEKKLPPMIEVDLGFDGVENEPPPLGEPDAGMGEERPPEPEPVTPPQAEEETQPPTPEPEQPETAPEPEMKEEAPAPEPVPQFEVPKEEQPPKPEPKPKPVAKAQPKPPAKPATTQPRTDAQPSDGGPAGSGLTTGRAGVRGSPGGQVGGRGGGRGDFVSTPHPQYDATARQRAYQGRGVFAIAYENGRIVNVTVNQSTGVPYLDARTIAWIKSRWRVKSGASGAATVPVTWQLQ
ncbi:hypothetical protein ACXR0O_27015 [Verrucomicrobiota bacterium sgz303538]